MQKWEYMSVSSIPSTSTESILYYDYKEKWQNLNKLGKKGWEVITISDGVAYLKRKIGDG